MIYGHITQRIFLKLGHFPFPPSKRLSFRLGSGENIDSIGDCIQKRLVPREMNDRIAILFQLKEEENWVPHAKVGSNFWE